MTRTQRVLDMNRVGSLGILTTSSLNLTSTFNFQLGGSEGVLQVDRVQTLAVRTASVDLLIDNIELGRV